MNRKLIFDQEFFNLTVPNSKEQQKKLEKSILSEGCLDPIIVWDGVIIDGYKRYLFCRVEGINYEVKEVFFPSRNKAIAWICRKRIPGLSPRTPIHKYLSGKLFISLRPAYEEILRREETGFDAKPIDRRKIFKSMAPDLGVGYTAVEAGTAYAHKLDKIAKKDPDIFRAMMEGRIKVTVKEINALSRGDVTIRNDIKDKLYPFTEKLYSEPASKRHRGGLRDNRKIDRGVSISAKIKEMPKFDPDMEIRGLTLTIPTWMAAIARAEKKTDMKLATKHAKKQLANGLKQLEQQIQETLEAIERQ